MIDRLALWARETLHRSDVVILDTETTGLGGDAEIIEIAIIDTAGAVVLDSMIRPTRSISVQATAIHRLTDADVATAPTITELWPLIVAALRDKEVLIYNASFDTRLLEQSCKAVALPRPAMYPGPLLAGAARYTCVWQRNGRRKLDGGDHSAKGDCLATLRLLRQWAGIDERGTDVH